MSEISSEPLSTQNPVPTKKTKLPLILLVLVLLFLFGFGGIFLGKYLLPTLVPKPTAIPTTTSDMTANWKTYTTQKFEFSFKYPPNLKPIDNSNYAKPGTLSVGFSDHPFNIQIEELAKVNTKNYLNMPKVSQKIINGVTWDILYFESKSPESGGPQTVYQTTNKDYRYIVIYDQQKPTEIDQILSTFKFLDQQLNPANQTYSDLGKRFTFSYPSNLQFTASQFSSCNSNYNLPNKAVVVTSQSYHPPKSARLQVEYSFGISSDPSRSAPESCFVNPNNNSQFTQTITYNNQVYYTGSFGGAATGCNGHSEIYRTLYKNQCYELSLNWTQDSDWNNPIDTQIADTEEVSAFVTLGNILSTFKFTQ